MDSNIFPNNIILDFNPKIDSKNDLEKVVFDSYWKNQNFFGENKVNIEIKFIYERSRMDEICGYKTENWQVGYANKNKIFIFSPTVFDKVSNHPRSDFEYVLTHEIAHLFTNEIFKFFYPKWLHEGVAGYVAEQYKIRPVGETKKFSDLHDKNGWNKFHNYPQAYSFTKYLIDKFGKDKILEFLNNLRLNLKDNHSYNEFVKLFNSFLKSDFDKEVSTWLKLI